jgi:hypothetical protein
MRVSLVGADLAAEQDPSAIAAALMASGHRVQIVRCSSSGEVGAVAGRVLSRVPRLVCLCLHRGQDPRPLSALASRLRELGFQGHLTCAGPAESFHHQATVRALNVDTLVLRDYPHTLRELVHAIATHRPLAEISRLMVLHPDTEGSDGQGRSDPRLHESLPPTAEPAVRIVRLARTSGTLPKVNFGSGAKSA